MGPIVWDFRFFLFQKKKEICSLEGITTFCKCVDWNAHANTNFVIVFFFWFRIQSKFKNLALKEKCILPPLLLLLLLLPLDGLRKIFVNEFAILFFLWSIRLNGSYEELGVNCGGVVDEIFAVDVWWYWIPLWPGFFVISTAFFRAFINRNSLSMRFVRPASTCSNDSSQTGSSASICCFRIFNTCCSDGVSEVIGISGRRKIEWINGNGNHVSRDINPVRWRFTNMQLLVNVWSFLRIALKKGPEIITK